MKFPWMNIITVEKSHQLQKIKFIQKVIQKGSDHYCIPHKKNVNEWMYECMNSTQFSVKNR